MPMTPNALDSTREAPSTSRNIQNPMERSARGIDAEMMHSNQKDALEERTPVNTNRAVTLSDLQASVCTLLPSESNELLLRSLQNTSEENTHAYMYWIRNKGTASSFSFPPPRENEHLTPTPWDDWPAGPSASPGLNINDIISLRPQNAWMEGINANMNPIRNDALAGPTNVPDFIGNGFLLRRLQDALGECAHESMIRNQNDLLANELSREFTISGSLSILKQHNTLLGAMKCLTDSINLVEQGTRILRHSNNFKMILCRIMVEKNGILSEAEIVELKKFEKKIEESYNQLKQCAGTQFKHLLYSIMSDTFDVKKTWKLLDNLKRSLDMLLSFKKEDQDIIITHCMSNHTLLLPQGIQIAERIFLLCFSPFNDSNNRLAIPSFLPEPIPSQSKLTFSVLKEKIHSFEELQYIGIHSLPLYGIMLHSRWNEIKEISYEFVLAKKGVLSQDEALELEKFLIITEELRNSLIRLSSNHAKNMINSAENEPFDSKNLSIMLNTLRTLLNILSSFRGSTRERIIMEWANNSSILSPRHQENGIIEKLLRVCLSTDESDSFPV